MNIDDLCLKTTDAATLNILHACRDGHPLGKPYTKKENFESAAFVCTGRREFNNQDVEWLYLQANNGDRHSARIAEQAHAGHYDWLYR